MFEAPRHAGAAPSQCQLQVRRAGDPLQGGRAGTVDMYDATRRVGGGVKMSTYALRSLSCLMACGLVLTPAWAQAIPSAWSQPRATTTEPLSAAHVCTDVDVSRRVATAKPGDLLAPPQDVTAQSGLIDGRLYRVLYATSAPAGKVRAACAIAALPDGDSLKSVLIEGHGAWGLHQRCQPSMSLTNFVSGSEPSAQGAGPLFTTVKSGGAFIAPDYPAAGTGGNQLQPFVHGVAQGLSVLDAARAVTNNPTVFGLAPIAPNAEIPLVLAGYSQGGGAVLWAGQLAKYYFDRLDDHRLNLAGVMALEPGGVQLVAAPGEPRNLIGHHLIDSIMYTNALSAVYFSWVAQSWSQLPAANAGPIPFGPSSTLSPNGVLSAEGMTTAAEVSQYCSSDFGALGLAVGKYADPNLHRLLRSPFAGASRKGTWATAVDRTCLRLKDLPKKAERWCQWLQFNNAGPNGVNPFPKYATDNDGRLVPLYLLHGRNDQTVRCVDDSGDVDPQNCVTRQFYDSVAPMYCSGKGHLTAEYFAGLGHGDLYWRTMQSPEPGTWYFGSRFEQFVSGAIAGTLPRTCQQENSTLP